MNPFRRWLLLVVATAAIIAVPLLILGLWISWGRAMHDTFVGETGPVESRSDWPAPLRQLLDDDAVGIEIDVPAIRVHCLCQGWDPMFVWRIDAALGLFEHIEKRWRLVQVSDPRHYLLAGHTEHKSGVTTPAWWQPQDDGRTSFYVSKPVLGEGESEYYHVALDKGRNVIWVHYWHDF